MNLANFVKNRLGVLSGILQTKFECQSVLWKVFPFRGMLTKIFGKIFIAHIMIISCLIVSIYGGIILEL